MRQFVNGRPPTRALSALAVTLAMVAVLTGVARANPILAWEFDDAPPAGWASWMSYWEWMGSCGPTGVFQDLDPEHPYYACTEPMTANWSRFRMGTDICFANNYASQNQVVVQLRRGTFGNEGVLVADDTVTVTNLMPAQSYFSDFGVIPDLALTDESLIVKMIYLGPGGDTHVYWAGVMTCSILWAYGPIGVERSTWGRIKALYGP